MIRSRCRRSTKSGTKWSTKSKQQIDLNDTQVAVLRSLENASLSRKDIFAALGLSRDSRSFKRHIEPLLTNGLVEMTIPDKPNSRLQKYRLTEEGKKRIKAFGRFGYEW
ncbi:MAG: Fic family protein [Limnochordia bacterium]|jgi:DNA-binding MarR family transcriptional regulator